MVGVYTTSKSASDTFSYYTSNPKGLTTSGQKSVGTGSNDVGTVEYHGALHRIGHRRPARQHHLYRRRAEELGTSTSG